MLTEMLGRPLGVEALEDRFEIVLGNARSLVVDGDGERPAARRPAELDHDLRTGRAEREGIVDDIAEDLAVAPVVAMPQEWRIGGQPILHLDAAFLDGRGGDV